MSVKGHVLFIVKVTKQSMQVFQMRNWEINYALEKILRADKSNIQI